MLLRWRDEAFTGIEFNFYLHFIRWTQEVVDCDLQTWPFWEEFIALVFFGCKKFSLQIEIEADLFTKNGHKVGDTIRASMNAT